MADGRERSVRERRDMSPEGIARRARFEESLNLLRSLGLSPSSIEYFRQLARVTRQLPHELVREIADESASGSKGT